MSSVGLTPEKLIRFIVKHSPTDVPKHFQSIQVIFSQHPPLKELADLIIDQLKTPADEVFESSCIKTQLLRKPFENWPLDISSKFIDTLPEWLIDKSVHNGKPLAELNELLDVLLEMKEKFVKLTPRHTEVRKAMLRSMKMLSGDYGATIIVRKALILSIMKLEPEIVPEVIDYVLKSIKPEERYGFSNFLLSLRKSLNFEAMKSASEKMRYGFFLHKLLFF